MVYIHVRSLFPFSNLFEQTTDSKELDVDFSLEDLETVKVIGKGSGGVVQLVRHKWVGKFFALKVVIIGGTILHSCIYFWSFYFCFRLFTYFVPWLCYVS